METNEVFDKVKNASPADRETICNAIIMLQRNMRNTFTKFNNDCAQILDPTLRAEVMEENKGMFDSVEKFTEIIEMLQES